MTYTNDINQSTWVALFRGETLSIFRSIRFKAPKLMNPATLLSIGGPTFLCGSILKSGYMTYGPSSSGFIEKSKSLDSTNPRPVLLEAQSKFYTPEAFGGGKNAAKEYFERANALNEKFKPESDLSPNWGKNSIQYFLSQYK